MAKKKKHVQNEKEQAFQKAAAEKRIQREEEKRREKVKTAFWTLIPLILFFLGFVVCFSISVSRMRNFELNYDKVPAVVVGYETEHIRGTHHHGSSYEYFCIYQYEYGGEVYKVRDMEAFGGTGKPVNGTEGEVYVNPDNPSDASVVGSSDWVSIIGVGLLGGSLLPLFAEAVILCELRQMRFGKQLLIFYLPAVLSMCAFLLLSWLALPRSPFSEVFIRIRSSWGFVVLAALIILVAILEGIIITRKGYKKMRRR